MQIYFSPSKARSILELSIFLFTRIRYTIFLTRRTKKSDFDAANFYYFAYKYLSIEDASRRTIFHSSLPFIRIFAFSDLDFESRLVESFEL